MIKNAIISCVLLVSAVAQAAHTDNLIPRAERMAYPFLVEVTIQLGDKAQADAFTALAARENYQVVESSETSTYPAVRGDGREFPKMDAVVPAGSPASLAWKFRLAPIEVASREQLEAALARLSALDAFKTSATISFRKVSVTPH